MGDAMMASDVAEASSTDAYWAPPEGLTRHSGTPIEPDLDFFAPPPPEIGDLVSAESTLRYGKRPWKLASRIALSCLVGWAAAMAIEVIGSLRPNPVDRFSERVVETGVAAIAAVATWFSTRFSHTCSYVGSKGFARIRCLGNRHRLRPPDLFLFESAAELRTSQTRQYHNGVYIGTRYSFQWTDANGTKAYKLSGTYRGEKAPPKPKDPFHFAAMAEVAWSSWLFDRLAKELESSGSIRFRLSGKDYVAIGPGFLDVHRKGETEHLTIDEIGGILVDQGVVKIRRVDAKEGWFSSSGVTKIPYESMANCRLFGLAYSRLIGK